MASEPLYTFKINVPRYAHAFIPKIPYHEYPAPLREILPEDHLTQRVSELQKLIKNKFPTPTYTIAFTAVVGISVIAFIAMFFTSFTGQVPIWYSLSVAGSLLTISALYGMRSRKEVDRVKKFEAALADKLGAFTSFDLLKYNILWVLSGKPRRIADGIELPPRFAISIMKYDPDAEIEELPEYISARDYVQPAIVVVDPPAYEPEHIRMQRMERFVAGEPSSESVNASRRQVESVFFTEGGQSERNPWEAIVIDYSQGGAVIPREAEVSDGSAIIQNENSQVTDTLNQSDGTTATIPDNPPPLYDHVIEASSSSNLEGAETTDRNHEESLISSDA